MVTWLRRLFIKDYKNVPDPIVREKHGLLGATIGIVTNAILVLLKVGTAVYLSSLTGFAVFSVALIGDAINNLSDLASSIVTLISFKISGRPADKEHPFGHQRSEYVASLSVSIIVCCLAVLSFQQSLQSVIAGDEVSYDVISLVILGISILIKFFQGYVYRGLAKAIDSQALKASSFDSFSDMAATALVIVSAAVSYWTGYGGLDGYMGILLSLFVLYIGIKMVKGAVSPLLGNPLSKEDAKKIEETVLEEKEISGIHDLVVHDYGPSHRYASLHAEVDGRLPSVEGHAAIDRAEKRLKELGYQATIHLDPVETSDQRLESIKQDIKKALAEVSSTATFHDLRLEGDEVVLEVLLPFEEEDKKEQITEAIDRALKERKDGPYRPAVSFDTPYIEE